MSINEPSGTDSEKRIEKDLERQPSWIGSHDVKPSVLWGDTLQDIKQSLADALAEIDSASRRIPWTDHCNEHYMTRSEGITGIELSLRNDRGETVAEFFTSFDTFLDETEDIYSCGGCEALTDLIEDLELFKVKIQERIDMAKADLQEDDLPYVEQNETPGTEAPRASTENPFPVANCEERLSEPGALSSTADKMHPLILRTIDAEGNYERAKGWLRYEVLRTMDIHRFTELVNRNVAGENFDEMVDQIIVEREGL